MCGNSFGIVFLCIVLKLMRLCWRFEKERWIVNFSGNCDAVQSYQPVDHAEWAEACDGFRRRWQLFLVRHAFQHISILHRTLLPFLNERLFLSMVKRRFCKKCWLPFSKVPGFLFRQCSVSKFCVSYAFLFFTLTLPDFVPCLVPDNYTNT